MSRQLTPNERRWLNLISFAEGTWGPKGPRYDITFGYTPIKDLSRHPDRVVRSGRHASAAAGAYQFMPGTWATAAKALGLKDFGPASQDLAALYLMRKRGVDPSKDPISPQTLARLSPEWAAFPTLRGGSYYEGQSAKSYERLRKFAESQGAQLPSQRDWTQTASSTSPSAYQSTGDSAGSSDQLEKTVAATIIGNLATQILSGADVPSDPSRLNAPSRMPSLSSTEEEDDDEQRQLLNRIISLERELASSGEPEGFDPRLLESGASTRQMMAQLMSQAQQAFSPANVKSVI